MESAWGLRIATREPGGFETSLPQEPPETPQPQSRAVFSAGNRVIIPKRIIAGESAVVSSAASNTGGQEGTYSLTLNLDGIAKEAKEVTLCWRRPDGCL